jgi:hypothetical protein
LGSEPELAGKGSFCFRKLAFSGVFLGLIFLDWPISALFSVRDWLRFAKELFFALGRPGRELQGVWAALVSSRLQGNAVFGAGLGGLLILLGIFGGFGGDL